MILLRGQTSGEDDSHVQKMHCIKVKSRFSFYLTTLDLAVFFLRFAGKSERNLFQVSCSPDPKSDTWFLKFHKYIYVSHYFWWKKLVVIGQKKIGIVVSELVVRSGKFLESFRVSQIQIEMITSLHCDRVAVFNNGKGHV